MLDVPSELVLFVSGLLAARRRETGTRKGTRKLGCYRQALLGPAWFRDKGDIPRLDAGFGLADAPAPAVSHSGAGLRAARRRSGSQNVLITVLQNTFSIGKVGNMPRLLLVGCYEIDHMRAVTSAC